MMVALLHEGDSSGLRAVTVTLVTNISMDSG